MGPTRILIVDDNVHVRTHLKGLLVNADPSFLVCGEASTGKQAVSKAQELTPDVVILDLAMPVMDGIAAAREISGTVPGLAIFMYTIHTSRQLEIEAKEAGISHVVSKPDASRLIALLRQFSGVKNRECGEPH
jgi:two-component system chemotaxis response regulator CheY